MTKQLLAVLGAVLMLGACVEKSETNLNVLQSVTNPTAPGPSPSPSATACEVTSIVLGTGGDDFSLKAGGTDSVILVPSFYQGVLELPTICTQTLNPTYAPTGPCVLAGRTVTSPTVGTCTFTASVGAVKSNTITLTVVP